MKKIGIAGAGQLGLFLAQAAVKNGLEVSLLAESAKDPGAQAFPHFIQIWDGKSPPAEWLKQQDVVCFENENLSWEKWDEIVLQLKAQGNELPLFFPKLSVMKKLSDKLEQKLCFEKAGIPTAQFEEISLQSADSRPQIAPPYFLKWARGGYDGRGVFPIRHEADWNSQKVVEFVQNARDKGVRVYVEQAVPIEKELALVCVSQPSTSPKGAHGFEVFCFDLVETVQNEGICQWVLPMENSSETDSVFQIAKANAARFAKTSQIVGAFAIEFFLCKKTGELLANEMAPRVHNSGHWSLNGALSSQFEAHIRTAVGQKVSAEDLKRRADRLYCGMRNLVVPKNMSASGEIVPQQKPTNLSNRDDHSDPSSLELFWYEKRDFFAGRKMGHINFWAKSRSEGERLQTWLDSQLEKEGW